MKTLPGRVGRFVVASVAYALVAVACGSTVPAENRLAAVDASGDPLSLEDASLEGRPEPGRRGPGGSSAPGAAPSDAAPAEAGGPSAGPQFGRGVTSNQIRIGSFRVSNGGAANRAVGADVDPGDPDLYDRIMVNHINASGGVAGRKITMDYYTVDATNPQPTAVIEQSSCEWWTRDEPVFAVLANGSDSFKACLAKSGVPQLYSNIVASSDDRTFEQFPSYLEVNTLSLTRLARVLVDGLAEQRYFDAGAKVGLLTWDTPAYRRAIDGVFKPTLAAHGHRLAEEQYFKVPQSQADQADAIASVSGVVLRFKAAGIDRVVIMDQTGGTIMFFFGRNAQSQDYHPRYGLETASAPQFQVDAGTVDPEQFKGAKGVGWEPLSDVRDAPSTLYGPGYARCAKLMERGGADFAGNDNARFIALVTCDSYFFLKAAVEAGEPSITGASFVSGAEKLGARFPTATTPAVRFGPGRHDGVDGVRHFAFDGGCTCFKYTSDLRPTG